MTHLEVILREALELASGDVKFYLEAALRELCPLTEDEELALILGIDDMKLDDVPVAAPVKKIKVEVPKEEPTTRVVKLVAKRKW
jgi:hypothetical protein